MTIDGPELVVFDFDETIVDCNSDTFINELSSDGRIPEDIINKYYDHNNWTQYMKQVLNYLHKCGVTEENIRNCLQRMPLIDGIKELICNLKNCGPQRFELIIISDANTVFIGQALEFHQIDKAFRKVFTNPAKFDGRGCLQIEEYHSQDWCDISAHNLCKGYVLMEYINKRKEEDGIVFSRISYVGDGKNDMCPSFRLSKNDRVFARNGFPLHKRLANNQELKAQLNPFIDGHDIWKALDSRHINNNNNHEYNADFGK